MRGITTLAASLAFKQIPLSANANANAKSNDEKVLPADSYVYLEALARQKGN